uniref:Uncharacterized protein n=1 Tax=Acrobeloides nanus TaxID=290746 RepID=A0A914ECM4_9BILA
MNDNRAILPQYRTRGKLKVLEGEINDRRLGEELDEDIRSGLIPDLSKLAYLDIARSLADERRNFQGPGDFITTKVHGLMTQIQDKDILIQELQDELNVLKGTTKQRRQNEPIKVANESHFHTEALKFQENAFKQRLHGFAMDQRISGLTRQPNIAQKLPENQRARETMKRAEFEILIYELDGQIMEKNQQLRLRDERIMKQAQSIRTYCEKLNKLEDENSALQLTIAEFKNPKNKPIFVEDQNVNHGKSIAKVYFKIHQDKCKLFEKIYAEFPPDKQKVFLQNSAKAFENPQIQLCLRSVDFPVSKAQLKNKILKQFFSGFTDAAWDATLIEAVEEKLSLMHLNECLMIQSIETLNEKLIKLENENHELRQKLAKQADMDMRNQILPDHRYNAFTYGYPPTNFIEQQRFTTSNFPLPCSMNSPCPRNILGHNQGFRPITVHSAINPWKISAMPRFSGRMPTPLSNFLSN